MNPFWDSEVPDDEFDFTKEKQNLIQNLDTLASMTVEEQTLYKKWVELQDPAVIKNKSLLAELYDNQWNPTDIYDYDLTVREIENLDPYVEIVTTEKESTKWSHIRRMIHTMSWTPNPGRNVKLNIKDRVSGKLLGQVSMASDITSLAVRDKYIGWTLQDKFAAGKLNHTSIASTIVCTQPLGYNFLGGKLIATMTTTPDVRDYWKSSYGQTLVAVGTTSLYGIHSQYNAIPHFKTLGESAGKISIKPDDSIYTPWHQWIKENRTQWYEINVTEERGKDGLPIEEGDNTRSGPVSGIKQKIISKIFSECKISQSKYQHGFKRGCYGAFIYDNGNDFLCGKISEDELVMKKKFVEGIDYINNWWKPKAIRRYTKLHTEGRLKPDHLYYIDAVGISWDEMKSKYLSEVGR